MSVFAHGANVCHRFGRGFCNCRMLSRCSAHTLPLAYSKVRCISEIWFMIHVHVLSKLFPYFRAWQRKLHVCVKSRPNSEELYASLVSLLREGDRESFQTNLELFVQNWCEKEPDFVQYFQSTYVTRKGLNHN